MLIAMNIDEYLSDCEREAKEKVEKIAFDELRRERMRPNLQRKDIDPICWQELNEFYQQLDALRRMFVY